LILVVAGVGTIYIFQSRRHHSSQVQNERFISTYAALSMAQEKYRLSPDSLSAAYDSIFAANRVDSAWLSDFAASLPNDIHQSLRFWNEIVRRLDSLRIAPQADSSKAN
jgi:hypothetical protein